tara:strand:+ start:393 stop:650 length:258 start_codon:yes stop_codon:yes gene_type:complete
MSSSDCDFSVSVASAWSDFLSSLMRFLFQIVEFISQLPHRFREASMWYSTSTERKRKATHYERLTLKSQRFLLALAVAGQVLHSR